MHTLPDGGDGLSTLSHEFRPAEINMDLTMCGLLPDRAAELATLYREYGTWNEVKEVWFEERRAKRSTRGSSQKIYRVLTGRFKNAPTSLPNPSSLPDVLDDCATSRDRAQVLYLYLVADDALVRYVVHEYVQRMSSDQSTALDCSDETLMEILNAFEYADGTSFDYAESTTKRWCEGFRSVMRDIGVLDDHQSVVGSPPPLGDIPLLVAMGHSYEAGDDDWVRSPIGLRYLYQPRNRWEELYDRAAETATWEFIDLHGNLKLQPVDEPYAWVDQEVRD